MHKIWSTYHILLFLGFFSVRMKNFKLFAIAWYTSFNLKSLIIGGTCKSLSNIGDRSKWRLKHLKHLKKDKPFPSDKIWLNTLRRLINTRKNSALSDLLSKASVTPRLSRWGGSLVIGKAKSLWISGINSISCNWLRKPDAWYRSSAATPHSRDKMSLEKLFYIALVNCLASIL